MRMAHGNLEFQPIYDTFRPRIRRYLARMVGDHEAEDLTQEVFIKVSRALGTFRGDAQLSTWIYRIATNAALDQLRSRSFQRVAAEPLPDDDVQQVPSGREHAAALAADQAPSVEGQVVRKEMADCFQEYVDRLSHNNRTVFVLSEFEGLSNQEIAQILGQTVGAVKARLHRARDALRRDLAAHCDPVWIEENEFLPDLRRALGPRGRDG